MEEAAKRSHPPHITLLADPGTGHLIPLSALAKHLHQSFNFSITLITQPISLSSQSQQKILNTLPKEIQVLSLPQIPIHSIPRNIKPHHLNLLTITHNIPCLCEMLKSMKPNVTAIVVDMFSMVAFDAVKELGIEIYSFFTSNSLSLALVCHVVRVGEERVDGEAVRMPGCVAIEERDLPDPFGADRQTEEYKESMKFWKLYHLPKAILVNSFEELEPGPINLLKSDKSLPPIYPVGPLILSDMSAGDSAGDRCLKWLDKQLKGSVVYVSFGSGGTLSRQQTNELAYGLEMSGQRFIWVVKSPNEAAVSADYFGAINAELDPLEFVPSGFIERTKGVGMLIPTWAPQIQILSHWATGGFVTHCGWNSTLESIMNEIPMIVWPLYAEQNMNAVMLVEDLKVAVRVEMDGNGVVGKEQISTLVRNVMEGEEGKRFRNRMREIKEAAKGVLEEGGSSYKSLCEIASQWDNLQA